MSGHTRRQGFSCCRVVASSNGSPNGSGSGSPSGSGSGLGPVRPTSGSDPAHSGGSSAARGADCGPLEPAVPPRSPVWEWVGGRLHRPARAGARAPGRTYGRRPAPAEPSGYLGWLDGPWRWPDAGRNGEPWLVIARPGAARPMPRPRPWTDTRWDGRTHARNR
jgi:hypothetical protein